MIGSLKKTVDPDDALGAIFALTSTRSKKDTFRAHNQDLQRIFYNIVEEEGSEFLKERFIFSTSGPTPYSPALSEAMTRLQLSGLIGKDNPDYVNINIKPAANKYFEEILKNLLTESDIKELERATDSFVKHINRLEKK